MSYTEVSRAFEKLQEIFENIETGQKFQPEEIFSSLFQDNFKSNHTDDYPDIFKHLFLDLCEKI